MRSLTEASRAGDECGIAVGIAEQLVHPGGVGMIAGRQLALDEPVVDPFEREREATLAAALRALDPLGIRDVAREQGQLLDASVGFDRPDHDREPATGLWRVHLIGRRAASSEGRLEQLTHLRVELSRGEIERRGLADQVGRMHPRQGPIHEAILVVATDDVDEVEWVLGDRPPALLRCLERRGRALGLREIGDRIEHRDRLTRAIGEDGRTQQDRNPSAVLALEQRLSG
jgi:hypothetical protein